MAMALPMGIYFGLGPDGEIPLDAQFRGPARRGLSNIGIILCSANDSVPTVG